MCLIAYVPKGTAIPRDFFDYSAEQNPDGFGVMSAEEGIKKFFGRKARKRCRRYTKLLSERGIVHAVHWRWKTHGEVSEANCHPFTTPNGQAHVMHNGVLSATAKYATAEKSDTRLFVDLLTDAPAPVAPGESSPYWGGVERAIGWSNKFVVLNGPNFYILNEDAGIWIDGVWYSNTYSLPLGAPYGAADDSEDDGDVAYAIEQSEREDRAYWDNLLNESNYVPGMRYDVNLGRWRQPEEKKREDWKAWVTKLAGPSGPTLDTATYPDCMLPIDGAGCSDD